MPSGAQIIFSESGRGLGHVTTTIFGSTVGYPSDSLASCFTLPRYIWSEVVWSDVQATVFSRGRPVCHWEFTMGRLTALSDDIWWVVLDNVTEQTWPSRLITDITNSYSLLVCGFVWIQGASKANLNHCLISLRSNKRNLKCIHQTVKMWKLYATYWNLFILFTESSIGHTADMLWSKQKKSHSTAKNSKT